MSAGNSSRRLPQSKPTATTSTPSTPALQKPEKPSADFPLFAHHRGYWAKKIRGRTVYFGPWDDPDGALTKYLEQKDDLHAGRGAAHEEALTLFQLCARFLKFKKDRVDSGELSHHSLAEYSATCRLLLRKFGRDRPVTAIGPRDFERYRAAISKRWGFHRVGNDIVRVRSVFRYGEKNGLLLKPILFGSGFERPSKKVMRNHRHQVGLRMFQPDEIRRMLESAGQPLKAMILLGINCGFGNSDLGTMPVRAIDLERGWVEYPRPKTGIPRRCPLWSETVESVREWLKIRPADREEATAGLVFLTQRGGTWERAAGQSSKKSASWADSPLSKQMRKLLDKLKIDGNRNFYALRHTFQTIGDESRDFIAVRKIMGHAMDEDIAEVYRERVSDERLQAVADHVRGWLFGPKLSVKKPTSRKARAPRGKAKASLRLFAG